MTNMAMNPVFMARGYRMNWPRKELLPKRSRILYLDQLSNSTARAVQNTLGEATYLRHASRLSREKILTSEYRSARTFSGWGTPKICPRRLIQILLRFFVLAE